MIPVHNHLVSCISSLIKGKEHVRILDAGCGSLGLIQTICQELPKHWNGVFEIYGYDIEPYYTFEKLSAIIETSPVLAEKKLSLNVTVIDISSYKLPYDDAFFDLIVSNQVVEHVQNLQEFYAENTRVLKVGGNHLFCFPTLEVIVEPHLFVPFVHRIADRHRAKLWLKTFWSRRNFDEKHLDDRLDYLETDTNYQLLAWHMQVLKSLGLDAKPRFNTQFLVQRLVNILGFHPVLDLAWLNVVDRVCVQIMSRIGSPTIVALKV